MMAGRQIEVDMRFPYKGAGIALFRKADKADGGYEIFLGKRSIRQDFGKWSVPGGGFEKWDQDLLRCAEREFLEETGCPLPQAVNLGRVCYNFLLFKWTTFIFLTEDPMNHTRASEFSVLKWVPLAELDKLDLCFGVKQEVRKFIRLCR